MTRIFTVVNNDVKFEMIKNIFVNNSAAELEEFIDGNRHQLTVSCDDLSASGKMIAKNIMRVEKQFGKDEDVEVY